MLCSNVIVFTAPKLIHMPTTFRPYFRISLRWDKNKWGKWILLLVSWCYFPHLFLSRSSEILKFFHSLSTHQFSNYFTSSAANAMETMSNNSATGIVMGNTDGSLTAAVIQDGGQPAALMIGLEPNTPSHMMVDSSQQMSVSKNSSSVQLSNMVSNGKCCIHECINL